MGTHAHKRSNWPIVGGVALATLVAALVLLGGPPKVAQADPNDPLLAELPTQPAHESALVQDRTLPVLAGKGPLVVRLQSLPNGDPLPPIPGVDLRGMVMDDFGNGIAGVRLEVLGGPHQGRVANSGPDGNYVLRGLMPGTHRLSLQGAGPSVGRLQRVLSRGTTHRNFMMGSPVSAGLRFRNHLGKPLVGAKVSVDFGSIEATTDEDGIVFLEGIPRSLRVVVDVVAEGHAWVREELNFLPPPPADPVALASIPQSGRIRGRVQSWPGGPLPRITVLPRADRPGNRSFAWEKWQDIEVSPEGIFELDGLPADGLVDVCVFHPMGIGSPALRSVQPGIGTPATVSFVIVAQSRTLVGKVVDGTGKPIAGAQVTLESRDPGAVLAALFPGLRAGTVAAQLPVLGSMRRTMPTGPLGNFQLTWADHTQGTGDFLLRATLTGYRATQIRIRTARSNLKLVLEKEEALSSLTLQDPYGPPLPEVQWWVDGKMVAHKTETLVGLPAGIWSTDISRGEQQLLVKPRIEIAGSTMLRVR